MSAKVIESREDHVRHFVEKLFSRVFGRLWAVLFTKDFEYSELQNGVVMTLWGAWMLGFSDHDAAFSKAIGIMNDIAPEDLWAGMFVAIGMLKLYGLLWDVLAVRRAASMLAFVYWFYIFLALVTTSPQLFAVPVSLTFALSAVWGHTRLSTMRS
jgi:hypothetical protein